MYPPERFRDRLREALDPVPAPVPEQGEQPAAVLIPVLAAPPELRLVFTRRTDTLSRHAGEISFPGGLIDQGEEPVAAVLREAQEELGLPPQDVELLGALPPLHTYVSGILIVPFVGMLWRDPRFTPSEAEIAEVLEYPISALAAAGTEAEFERGGHRFQTFVFPMDGHLIWGATGRILREFLDLIEAEMGDAAGGV
jgi:8-oxo-dGTP pyrophosphatase MutT (NUDIX family)